MPQFKIDILKGSVWSRYKSFPERTPDLAKQTARTLTTDNGRYRLYDDSGLIKIDTWTVGTGVYDGDIADIEGPERTWKEIILIGLATIIPLGLLVYGFYRRKTIAKGAKSLWEKLKEGK